MPGPWYGGDTRERRVRPAGRASGSIMADSTVECTGNQRGSSQSVRLKAQKPTKPVERTKYHIVFDSGRSWLFCCQGLRPRV
jgi:hypothetical protein